MPDTLARAAIRLDRFATPSAPAHALDAAIAWEIHVDAGRIGNVPPPAPETAARRNATAARFAHLRSGGAA